MVLLPLRLQPDFRLSSILQMQLGAVLPAGQGRVDLNVCRSVGAYERGGPITDSSARKIIASAGEQAGISFPVHLRMLRHACGFTLANGGHDTRAIQAYLGHKNIQHTVRYIELSSERFSYF